MIFEVIAARFVGCLSGWENLFQLNFTTLTEIATTTKKTIYSYCVQTVTVRPIIINAVTKMEVGKL